VTLTPEQKAAVAQWNSLGAQVIDNSMRHFMPSWFANIRSLIRACAAFRLHSVKELVEWFHPRYDTFTVLGSGPSIPEIAKCIPRNHEALLCGPTCVGALTRYDITPDIIVVSDSNSEQYRHVVESQAHNPSLKIVLPVTCDPEWYSPVSVLDPSQLYFYLPYLSYEGSIDLGFNQILKALFPDVPWQITQAGSVANAALNIADWCCGEDSSKRVYLAVDCSWVKGGAMRAPLRFETESHSEVLQRFWIANNAPKHETIELPWGGETVVTELLPIGYAINMLYLIHEWERDFPFKQNRYALVSEASKLFNAAAPAVLKPLVSANETSLVVTSEREDAWAYKTLLGLVEVSNRLHSRLRSELADKILVDWRRDHEVQNVVDIPLEDFRWVVRTVHAVEPSVAFRFNGQDVEVAKENPNA
jgi:hypothetical protein